MYFSFSEINSCMVLVLFNVWTFNGFALCISLIPPPLPPSFPEDNISEKGIDVRCLMITR